MTRAFVLCGLCLATSVLRADEPRISFSRDIRPILSERCFQCHGPDEQNRQAELRLDRRDDFYRQFDDHRTVVPGEPAESELFRRVTSDDEFVRMPPADAGPPLEAKQIELLRRWIEQGAEWQGHWAFVPPAEVEPPEVGDSPFVRNEIDRFVLAKLRKLEMQPAEPADRVTLIRRLSFDLTGLPPTPEEVDAFVSDASDDAYEKLVDRLLASPHFGERLAQYWLDLVRYADTNGYHGDNHRDIWLYRDYVIEAFNDNKPFDRFTIEQLAGDLLPEASTEQRVASGYNRLLMTTREGGAQAKEYRAKYAADRVRNVSSVWLGATMGCAECHDHKYDPYLTKDFYRFAAFFADIDEVAVGQQPGTPIPSPDQAAAQAAIEAELAPLRQVMNTQTPELDAALAAWERERGERNVEWSVLTPQTAESSGGATLEVLEDGSVRASGKSPDKATYSLTFENDLTGVTALRLEVLPDDSLPQKGPGRAGNGNFVVNEITARLGEAAVEFTTASATHSQKNFVVEHAIDAKPKTGWAILDRIGVASHAVFETRQDLQGHAETPLTITLRQNHGGGHTLGRFRIAATTAARPVRAEGVDEAPEKILAILEVDPEQRNERQLRELAAWYRTIAPLLEPTRRRIAELEKQKDALVKSMPTTLVSNSVTPRTMRVLPRGNWLDDSGEVVSPGVPAFLPQIEAADRASRLELARWIVDEENPLTARVFVNRMWYLTFGAGLVRTLDDFGSQGATPTHPRLLDWLALEFVENGWNVKRLIKTIVMSGTYRQSSSAPDVQRADPYNQWLARQGRFRLSAEAIRDNALAVSGLLVPTVGGASAKPYQPAGYWAHLNFPKRNYKADSGAGLYRRGLYTYWCRTFLHPSLLAFDATTREECAVERPRSNTPLQALVLLNDPTYVEASRVMAARILREAPDSTGERIQFLYRETLSRPARPAELALLTELYEKHLAQYRERPAEAKKLLEVGAAERPNDQDPAELAAWTSVVRVVFNLHETITRS